MRLLLALLSGLLAFNLGCTSFRDCTAVDASAAEALPESLSQTGLYADIENDMVSEGVVEFTPRFPLWTDGASKRRWLLLPDGERVDTQDPDDWDFPVGTKFFKEFTRDGVRLETRMNTRTETGWTGVAYVWTDGGEDATRQLESAEDVGGTAHDVPGATECLACHAGRRNFTLGFSATQLEVGVRSELFEAGVLSHRVDAEIQLPPTAMAALGVLHGNCSHCHNSTRHDQPQATTCYSPDPDDAFDLSLPFDLSSLDAAPALLTASFHLKSPRGSEVLDRISSRNKDEDEPSMPPLGTELVDDDGVAAVEAFIAELPATSR